MSQNILHGAHRDGRWPRLAEIIRRVSPSMLLLQECRGWLDDDMRQVAQAEHDLAMRVVVARSRTGGHTVVAFRRDPAVRWLGMEHNLYTLSNGYGAARFKLPGVDAPLVVISAHLTCYSADTAAQEAQVLIARAYRHGGVGLIGGDINHCPLWDDEPDWERVQPYNRTARCLPRASPDEPWRANTIVGQTFADAEMTDVAAHLANARSNRTLRAPTGKHGCVRVDQFHVTPALHPAIVDYWRIDPGDASDHFGIVTVIDTNYIDHSRIRNFT
jgi:endonuclease/exonuclease/phosphatase family metal-dependent hydrolase